MEEINETLSNQNLTKGLRISLMLSESGNRSVNEGDDDIDSVIQQKKIGYIEKRS